MRIHDLLYASWPYLATFFTVGATLATAFHILYKKRNTRAAAGWLGLVWFAPVLGVCLYWMFGVNRIKRRARLRLAEKQSIHLPQKEATVLPSFVAQLFDPIENNGLAELSRMTEKLTRQPLIRGNSITPLLNGDTAFPRMLAAIEKAERSLSLCSYIFDNDSWGNRFRSALKAASARGVDVKVLIDGVGARYSFPSMTRKLRKDGIDTAEFMRTLLPWRFQYFNLRNHRKILVVDGRLGFTGGMNIRDGHCLADNPRYPVQDIHFRFPGAEGRPALLCLRRGS